MEILAPAGNESSLKATVACGADAVYLGTKDFNARSKADNFSDEQLRLAISYCHERGVRVYITLNTLVKDSESSSALSTVKKASEAGADAFLIQDLGLYLALRKEFPDVSFHTSTQMGVHNLHGAIMAEKLGFDRIVLSREILPVDIEAIKRGTKLETELFVHGAHCVSFSGNCYFSAVVSGYSGNRGKCLQLCRKRYELTGGGKRVAGYLLSAKDICMLTDIKKPAIRAIDSLKIEGRLRSPEYVGTVTDVYKRALLGKSEAGDIDLLKTVFNRGNFSHAYMAEDKPDIIYPLQQNNIGLRVGSVLSLSGNNIVPDRKFHCRAGDGYKILRGGREVGSAFVFGGKLRYAGRIGRGDSICLTKSADIEQHIAEKVKVSEHNTNIEKISKNARKNTSAMPDIVLNKFCLPDKCLILQTDERCAPELKKTCDLIILSPSVYNAQLIEKFIGSCDKPVLLDMPIEARGKDVTILENIIAGGFADGYVANNIYALEMCKDAPVLLGMGMNSISSLLEVPKIMSPEAVDITQNAAIYAFGRATLMNLTHCPKKQLGFSCRNCSQCTNELEMRDEMKNDFLLRRHSAHYCYWELLNGKITNLFPKLGRRKHKRVIVDARNIDLDLALNALNYNYDLTFDERSQTYGRFGKGVK